MNKVEIQEHIAETICGKEKNLSCEECFKISKSFICHKSSQCRISEKTVQQLKYVISSIESDVFLEACPGSGKTEVVGMKAAYEINQWNRKKVGGVAILTFTNEATDVIRKRIGEFSNNQSLYPHYVGTVSSFIHEFIAQPFGYILKKRTIQNSDYSFKLIDKRTNVTTSPWLNNFKCKIGYARENAPDLNIYSHQIYYDYEKDDWLIPLNQYKDIYFEDHYKAEAFQKKVMDIRAKRSNNWMYKYEYCSNLLLEDKRKILEAGFANFEDMNNIALEVFEENHRVRDILSRKFPIIIVDECQDLSWVEIMILDMLKKSGSKLHFVGDLNQSVYEFKRVDPTNTLEFVKDFDNMQLINNFRSCHEIVEFTKKITPNINEVNGMEKSLHGKKSLLYIEYNEPKEAVYKYKEILEKININTKKVSVIVKQNSLKNELLNSNENEVHLMIVALQLWMNNDATQKQIALKLVGKQVSKWFGDRGSKLNYYCPKGVDSIFRWRIFLRDILDECIKNIKLMNFERKYGKWYADARKELASIIINCFENIEAFTSEELDLNSIFQGTWYRASNATEEIRLQNTEDKQIDFEVVTVHGAKGCTYDSTLVLSSKTRKSQSGHWKAHWLEGNDEDKRVGYVASTRAKFLLVWGVPKLTNEDRVVLEDLGFINHESILSSSI